MFEAADDLRTEYAELERQLSDPSIHADLTKARKIGRRYSELTPIVRSLDAHRWEADAPAPSAPAHAASILRGPHAWRKAPAERRPSALG